MKNTIDWIEVTREQTNHNDEFDHQFAFCKIHYVPLATDTDVVQHANGEENEFGEDEFWECDECGRDLNPSGDAVGHETDEDPNAHNF
jgi:hypothetical protein